jgi:hypothetical protein
MMMGRSKSSTIEPTIIPVLMDVWAVADKEQIQPQSVGCGRQRRDSTPGRAVKQQPQQVVYKLGFLSRVNLTDIYLYMSSHSLSVMTFSDVLTFSETTFS